MDNRYAHFVYRLDQQLLIFGVQHIGTMFDRSVRPPEQLPAPRGRRGDGQSLSLQRLGHDEQRHRRIKKAGPIGFILVVWRYTAEESG